MKIDALKNNNSFKSNIELKNKKVKVSNHIKINNSSVPYFNALANTSNVNRALLNTKNSLSFKANLTILTKSLIRNTDIPKGSLELDCHNVHLDGSISLRKIIAKAKEAFFDSDCAAGHVELNDSVSVGEIQSNSIAMNGNSKVKKAITKYLAMFDSTNVESAHSANIELKNKPSIEHIFADEDLTLYGEGTVGDIECKGDKIFITGPIQINGKIKFGTPSGEVHVLKNKKGESATISNRIENGALKYQMQTKSGNIVTVNKNVFSSSLESVLAEIKDFDKIQKLGKYKDIQSVKTLYAGTKSKLSELNTQELAQAKCLYSGFAQNTLLTLAESGEKKFTAFWAKNKKIGDKNLVDFWLSSVGIKAEGKAYTEKAKLLNELSAKQKQELVGKTVDYWVKEILPKQLKVLNKNDISLLNASKTGKNVFDEISSDRKKGLIKIINEEGITRFEQTQKGNKSLIDFWIDTIEGNGSAKEYTSVQKKRRLLEIASSDEDLTKIYKATIDENDEASMEVKNTQKAYKNLIEDAELDKNSKELLNEYFNSRLFMEIVIGKAKAKKSTTILEVTTQSLIKNLQNEKDITIQYARNNIFEPLKDFGYISQNSESGEVQGKVQIVLSILKDKISTSLPADAEKTKKALLVFNKSINSADGETEFAWKQLLTEAQQYFESSQAKKITDINLEHLYQVQKTLEKELPSEIRTTLEDKRLSTIQKAFIAKHHEDNNLINLLQKPAVNRSEGIQNLITSEQLNNNVFDALSNEFRKNISPETIKAMPEMADTYIKLLGREPSRMTNADKYYFLSEIPDEELELASRNVKNNWSENYLSKYMSDSILEKVRAVDSGYQASQMSKKLDTISVQLDGQQHTLLDISQNIDHFIDVYKVNSAETNTHLSQMAKTMEDIHVDTSNIKTNVKAMLFHSIQSTSDPVLKKEMGELLQDADRMELSEFLKTVEYKQKLYAQDHKMQKACGLLKQAIVPALIVGGAIAAGPFAPAVATFLAVHGAPALVGHYVSSGIIGHAVNTAIQCSSPKLGFIASLVTKGKFGDMSYGETPHNWSGTTAIA